MRDSGLSFLSRVAFEAFAEKHHPEFCQSLFRLLTKRVRERDKVVAATSFLSLKGPDCPNICSSCRTISVKKLDRGASSSLLKKLDQELPEEQDQ